MLLVANDKKKKKNNRAEFGIDPEKFQICTISQRLGMYLLGYIVFSIMIELHFLCIFSELNAFMHDCSVVSDSLQSHGLQSFRLLSPWNFPGQKLWSGFPFPTPGHLPGSGIEPTSLASASRFFTSSAIWEDLSELVHLTNKWKL